MQFDTLTPVDRFPDSPTRGRAILAYIPLLTKPGLSSALTAIQTGRHVSGALAPYTIVTVQGYHAIGATLWALVSARQGGWVQEGWCNVMLLENAGAELVKAMSEEEKV